MEESGGPQRKAESVGSTGTQTCRAVTTRWNSTYDTLAGSDWPMCHCTMAHGPLLGHQMGA